MAVGPARRKCRYHINKDISRACRQKNNNAGDADSLLILFQDILSESFFLFRRTCFNTRSSTRCSSLLSAGHRLNFKQIRPPPQRVARRIPTAEADRLMVAVEQDFAPEPSYSLGFVYWSYSAGLNKQTPHDGRLRCRDLPVASIRTMEASLACQVSHRWRLPPCPRRPGSSDQPLRNGRTGSPAPAPVTTRGSGSGPAGGRGGTCIIFFFLLHR